MAKTKKKIVPQIPDIANVEALKGVLTSTDELEYGVRGVVRILSGSGKSGKIKYFMEGFRALFASELGEKVDFAYTTLDHENLVIIIKLPDPKDPSQKESVRHYYLREYTMGADDLKTRAALTAFAGLDAEAKQALISKEKQRSQSETKSTDE